ncbi:hypothetical protein AKJ40_03880 [candidate division MSBL1 archaeon SCGC-AAA259M10]|uniref:Uncharacterized protein n=1 Tax=candidate division MSBL1 archaeon SCGC-AAA259M10 TaxID=1698270 RepID=A0A133UY61_9EURY|nr:hypothetical protein AKJ40_03880 [candidate division MSBL1 archaeon SCGC-AAA259M10]
MTSEQEYEVRLIQADNERLDEYREHFARTRKQSLNTFGWVWLVDDLRAEAPSGAARSRLKNIQSSVSKNAPWFNPEDVLKEFLHEEWGNLEKRREEVRALVEKCELFSLTDKKGNTLEMSERVKAALLTEVFGLVEVHREDKGTCPAYKLTGYTFESWVMKSVGLVGEHLVDEERMRDHVDLMTDILEEGGMDMIPDLSYPCSQVIFVTSRKVKTVVLWEKLVELGRKKIRLRETIEMEKGETIQLPEETTKRLMKQGAVARFVYRCESCNSAIPRNEPSKEPPQCPECGSSNIQSVHPETPEEVADVLRKYYRQGLQTESSPEDLMATFATGLSRESYPRISAEQTWELGSRVVPRKGAGFLDKVVDRFMWARKTDKRISEGKSSRHEGNGPIERIAREDE